MDELEARLRELGTHAAEKVEASPITPRDDVMRKGRLRRIGVAVASSTLVLVLAAAGYAGAGMLGGRRSVLQSPDVLRAAAERTTAEGTARTAFAMDMAFEFDGREMTSSFAAVGEVSFEEGLSHMTMQGSGEGMPDTSIEMIQDGGSVYTKGEPGTEGWVKRETTTGGVGLSDNGLDPDEFLTYLSGVSDDIENLGVEHLGQSRVTHYRAIVDPELIDENVTESQRAALSSYDIDYDPLEVWVDQEGLVRKLVFGISTSGEGSGRSFDMAMRVTTSFYDFGMPVEIEIPDDGEITEDENVDANTDGGSQTVIEGGSQTVKGSNLRLLGAEGFDGPNAEIAGRKLCAIEIPGWARLVELVDTRTGEPVGSVRLHVHAAVEEENNSGCSDEPMDSLESIARITDFLVLEISRGERRLEVPITRVLWSDPV